MQIIGNNLKFVEVSEGDCNLILPFDKITKELGLKSFPSNKTKIKIRGKHYKILGGLGGQCYLKEL